MGEGRWSFLQKPAANWRPSQGSLVALMWFYIFSAPILQCNKTSISKFTQFFLTQFGWRKNELIFFCLFLQILYNKIKIHSICLKNKWGKKIRRKFVCISSCTLALNVRGFSGLANVHFGCGFDLLGDFKGKHTRTDITPLTLSSFPPQGF